MPEARHHHVLDSAGFAVGELNFDLLTARSRRRSGLRWYGRVNRRNWPGLFRLWLDRLTVPLGIAEVMMRPHEIVDREVVLPIIKPRPAPDDLLELDHRVDGAHQHDVADVARVHAGREFLRCSQDRGDGLFVILKVPQVLLTKRAIVGRHPLAIVRVLTGLHLVDEVAYG